AGRRRPECGRGHPGAGGELGLHLDPVIGTGPPAVLAYGAGPEQFAELCRPAAPGPPPAPGRGPAGTWPPRTGPAARPPRPPARLAAFPWARRSSWSTARPTPASPSRSAGATPPPPARRATPASWWSWTASTTSPSSTRRAPPGRGRCQG